ncbi:MAG: glycosyltransferase family 2 protein [Proteobacteria bacterium]|nr:glycosyltransferase family 2 protein [Pseudomonadota bacterium]
MSSKRCIIIPAFNEEKQIASVIEGIRRYSSADIVVIDDGSVDRTCERAKSAGVFVIRHPFNMGAGVAIQTGFKYASENHYDFLLQIDGDGQHHPAHIPDLFSMIENKKYDLVIGSRFLKNSKYKTGVLKSVGIRLFRKIVMIITGEPITDPTSGYRCMNQNVFQYFTTDSFPWDYPDADIIIDLHRMGFKIAELPVTMAHNPEGRSMHRGIFKITYYLFNVFLSIFVVLLRKKSRL